MKVSIIQTNSKESKKQNLLQAKELIIQAIREDTPDLLTLPELFTGLGGSIWSKKSAAEDLDSQEGEAYLLLKKLAREFSVYIHGGSICERSGKKFYNTSVIFNKGGEEIARYRKANLFAAILSDNTEYDEAQFFSSGNENTIYRIEDIKIGCAICFDIRFGRIFQKFIEQDVKVIVIPAAFTYQTGSAHWEVLCRARAIETQSYVIAPAQTGTYKDNETTKKCFGHSLIVDPWGNVVAKLNEEVGYVTANLDFDLLNKIRKNMPLNKNVKQS